MHCPQVTKKSVIMSLNVLFCPVSPKSKDIQSLNRSWKLWIYGTNTGKFLDVVASVAVEMCQLLTVKTL